MAELSCTPQLEVPLRGRRISYRCKTIAPLFFPRPHGSADWLACAFQDELDDKAARELDAMQTRELHFGGGEAEAGDDRPQKSKKEAMEELIAKSKYYKARGRGFWPLDPIGWRLVLLQRPLVHLRSVGKKLRIGLI
jgi:hypothetical protein